MIPQGLPWAYTIHLAHHWLTDIDEDSFQEDRPFLNLGSYISEKSVIIINSQFDPKDLAMKSNLSFAIGMQILF